MQTGESDRGAKREEECKRRTISQAVENNLNRGERTNESHHISFANKIELQKFFLAPRQFVSKSICWSTAQRALQGRCTFLQEHSGLLDHGTPVAIRKCQAVTDYFEITIGNKYFIDWIPGGVEATINLHNSELVDFSEERSR